jgi:hypothetical protein
VVGGFLITDRMLKMFKSARDSAQSGFSSWTLIALGALMIPEAFWHADLVVVIVLAVAALWYFAALRGRLARGEAGVERMPLRV